MRKALKLGLHTISAVLVTALVVTAISAIGSIWNHKAAGFEVRFDLVSGQMEKTWFWMGIAVVKADQEFKFSKTYTNTPHAGAPTHVQWVLILTDGLLRPQRIVSNEGKAIHVAEEILEIVDRFGLDVDELALKNAINSGDYRTLDKMRAALLDLAIEQGPRKKK